MEATAVRDAKVNEDDAVRCWRIEQLHRAGYPLWAALALGARREVDIHRAADMLRDGCPVEIAVRILA